MSPVRCSLLFATRLPPPPCVHLLQLIMWGIILLLLGAIGLVLYAKF